MQYIRLIFKSPESEQPPLENQRRWQKGSLIFIYKIIYLRQKAEVSVEVIVEV